MPRLQGKRALITGGTSGIGLETTRRFLEEGARVAITGLSKTALDAARKELRDVIVIEADASDATQQGKVADEIRNAFGQLDVLFINAGIADLKPIGQWDTAAFDRSFNTNVKGPYFLLQALLPVFAKGSPVGDVQETRISVLGKVTMNSLLGLSLSASGPALVSTTV